MNREWMDDAACATTDPDAFFPERGNSSHAALKVCASCPVARQCLEFGLAESPTFGIYGGTGPYQRRGMVAS